MIKITERGEEESIDLVYLWVDGGDPEWQRKRLKATGLQFDQSEENSQARYISNDELKYALRSVEENIPWIRKVFIVTDNQIPKWLKLDHPKIKIIDHTEILPLESIPCFNSRVIEYNIHKIKGLSEQFLYGNDDTLINVKLSESFFFNDKGFPIVRLKKKPLGKWHSRIRRLKGKDLGQYRDLVEKSKFLIEEKFGKYYPGIPHHNIDAYKKSDYKFAVENEFSSFTKQAMKNKVRSNNDIQRIAFDLFALSIDHAQLQYVSRKVSRRIDLNKPDYEKYFSEGFPKLFCMNDTQNVTDEDRKRAQQFLERKFPKKSSFEK